MTLACEKEFPPEMQAKRGRCIPFGRRYRNGNTYEQDPGDMIPPNECTSALRLFCPATWDHLDLAGLRSAAGQSGGTSNDRKER